MINNHLRLLLFSIGLLSVSLLNACATNTSSLRPPKDLKATPGNAKLTLSWTAVQESNVAGYILVWQANGKSDSKEVGLETNAIIDKLQNGVAYSVTVATKDTNGNRSAPSPAVTATPAEANVPDPSVPAPPAIPKDLNAVAQDGQVTLTWTANTESDLKHYKLFWGTSPANLDQTQLIPVPANNFVVKGLTNNTTYSFALEAETTGALLSGRSATVSATPKATPLAPSIGSVGIAVNVDGASVDLGLGNQVRQGSGLITLRVKGSRLATLTKATLGSLPLTISTKQDDSAELTGTIEHGAALGNRVLLLESDKGSVSLESAVEITRITSAENPQFNPSDTCTDPSQLTSCGLGTPNRPFRTLTKALSVAASGDTIFLIAGTYSIGETWPNQDYSFPPRAESNVPDNVSIVGQSKKTVILQGPGRDSDAVALAFAGSATLRNLTVTGFNRALVYVNDPYETGYNHDLTFVDVNVDNNFDGLFAIGAAGITIQGSSFRENSDGATGGSGVFISEYITATIEGNTTFEANGYGLYARDGRGIYLTNVTSTANAVNGFEINDHEQIILTGVKSLDNEVHGLLTDIVGDFRMRSCDISGNKGTGMTMTSGYGTIDLGTDADPGNNAFSNNTSWQIYDNRDADMGTIQAKGNFVSASGITTPSGTQTGPNQSSSGMVNIWKIERQGNSIAF